MFKFLIVILVLLSGNECSQRYDGIKLFDFEKFLKSKSFTSLLHSGKIGEPCRSHFEKLLKEIGETWALQSKLDKKNLMLFNVSFNSFLIIYL